MDHNNTIQIKIKNDIPDTHFFIFKNKRYPFKYDFFKHFSNYFSNNQSEIEHIQTIRLIDEDFEENLNLTEDIINSFINYVQHQEISLNNENVTLLNYLGKKYEVTSLIEATDNFIRKHHHELIIQILSIHQNEPLFDTSTYEKILSENFFTYIKDDRLFYLKFPILYRIFNQYENLHQNKNENSDKENKELIDFLFKCLDKYGREASIMFTFIDFCNQKSEILNKLITKYAKIFDFHYINSNFIKTIYDMNSEMIRKKELIQIQQEELFSKISSEIESLRNVISQLKRDQLHQKLDFEQKENEKDKEIEKLKMKLIEQNNKQIENENEIKFLKNEIKKIEDEIKDKEKYQLNSFLSAINKHKDDIFKFISSLFFDTKFIMKSFNHFECETQKFIIHILKSLNENDKTINNIDNLLSYLTEKFNQFKKKDQKTNLIYFLPNNADHDENNSNNIKEMKICITAEMTEILFENNLLNSDEFLDEVNNFSDLFFEVLYPSSKYDNIYNEVLKLKTNHQNKNCNLYKRC